MSSHQLLRIGLLAAVVAMAAPAPAGAEPPAFPYGVSAGEVRSTAAMFWTRAQSSGLVRLKVSRSLTASAARRPRRGPGSSTTVLRRVGVRVGLGRQHRARGDLHAAPGHALLLPLLRGHAEQPPRLRRDGAVARPTRTRFASR